SDTEIWASGIENILVHSADGGQTWQELAAPCRTKTQLLRIRFAGPRGYVTGRRCVAFTEDGGQTWQSSSLGHAVRYSWLYGIALTPTEVWAAGYREGLFHAGANDQWERIAIDRTNPRGGSQYGAKRIPVEAARAGTGSPQAPGGSV
ncbi:MAG: WD40/YVTN/BNR-like repeat-containing protein, partial [Candidatus Binatia bacterium]